MVDDDFFAEGSMFDGSSIAGWKAINESDMILMPDTATAIMDPFFVQPTLTLICDILEPATGQAYARDPRSTAKAAESYLAASGIGDSAFFGPEAEFFVFDDVRFSVEQNETGFAIDSSEGPYNSATDYEHGNLGTARGPKVVISRFHRLIARRTCDRKCLRSCQKWDWRRRNTITKLPRRSTNSV